MFKFAYRPSIKVDECGSLPNIAPSQNSFELGGGPKEEDSQFSVTLKNLNNFCNGI